METSPKGGERLCGNVRASHGNTAIGGVTTAVAPMYGNARIRISKYVTMVTLKVSVRRAIAFSVCSRT